ncbi:peptidyl-tRNA hydrolase [Glycocaulis albus]|jgi:PTH1 family peptidyl-tRNA hydrolase|uniref:Peptidyl-tRNA hydrolase n=1 Tax=Glycocaulis albus TaxID=1382801 RepID=A0ABQ1Y0U6_9PROT|nr:aminoacyl-tRNA hydrolase [Glycocaulis albus]MBV5258256.1 aminoacyl-tRNA hydrolase [Synechococcus moorigangaii CMS01]GGH08273.1 peptidyl-tRNA hydrolase [Glycocaulis albus]
MLIIAGLGNPESKYLKNRHNAGFMTLDVIAALHGFGPWREKFQSAISEGLVQTISGPKKALLMKPLTYYNNSGLAVRAAADFYRVGPEAVTVFHDELDLAPGKFRLKAGGGHGGNNGIRSIAAHIGPDFRRGRIGIGHPGDKNMVTSYVLSDFPKADAVWFETLTDAIARSFPLLAGGEFDAFQTRVTHLAPAPGGQEE